MRGLSPVAYLFFVIILGCCVLGGLGGQLRHAGLRRELDGIDS